jgi:TolB-like protein/DNA-binding winged helix-turn-helix (wHTH) protein
MAISRPAQGKSVHEYARVAQVFRFGVFELDDRAHELRRQGRRIHLHGQAYQILRLLLARSGDVVTRDELRQALWPSSVYVDFDHGLNNAIAKVRDALGETAGTPQFIETLPRLGYRFIYPVSIVPVGAVAPTSGGVAAVDAQRGPPGPAAATPRSRRRRRVLLVGVAVLVVGIAIATLWLASRPLGTPAAASPAREPAIAVLPFVNMSSDPDHEHFANGLSEELTNKLAGVQGLNVVGRTPSFYYKNRDAPASEIAERLNVDEFLEGSVRFSGSRVRVTVQLIDAKSGYHRWSQSYDRELADILQMQEEIARAVVAALEVQLVDADELRLRRWGTRDAEAYRLVLVARELKDTSRARELYEEALVRDPNFAGAHAGLADYYFRTAWHLGDPEASFGPGRAAAERAIELDPESSETLLARANIESCTARFRDDAQAYAHARRDYERALELDSANPRVSFDYARAIQWDEPTRAGGLFRRTAELSPLWELAQAHSLNRDGTYDERRNRLRTLAARSLDPDTTKVNLARAFLEMHWGHLDEAVVLLHPTVEEEFLPEFSKALWSAYMSLGDRDAARDVLAHRGNELAEALREAAALNMDGRLDDALASLERHRGRFPGSRVLDLPTARQALITGNADLALTILEERLADLARGLRPVSARNVMPALDLAAAYAATGQRDAATQLLAGIVAFLDGAEAPGQPMFLFLRARAHALAGERDLALAALNRAYDEGFRQTWALDLNPQPLLYVDSIDTDPAFAALRTDPRYRSWRDRIRVDNARQLERLRTRV